MSYMESVNKDLRVLIDGEKYPEIVSLVSKLSIGNITLITDDIMDDLRRIFKMDE